MAVALTGAAERPRATLMTALPLVWGEGDASDILQGRSMRSETLVAIEKQIDVRPIDVLSEQALGTDVAIIAQPRRLLPTELVDFDRWVRNGGRAIIFADPELVWPSRYLPGDSRRAPPVELLDPLFTHWEIALGDSDRAAQTIALQGRAVRMMASAAWTGPKTCTVVVRQVLDCRISKGRVVLVGDADMLDAGLWQPAGAANPDWVVERIKMFSRANATASNTSLRIAIGGATLALLGTVLLITRRRREHTWN